MTEERYKECQKGMLQLTQEEIDEGWHYCISEWDGMLCLPTWEEAKVCGCEVKIK